MKRIAFIVLPLLIATVVSFGQPNRRPNIILMMADDMGYSDIGCYGSEIQTPRLDSLAKDGVRFTQFYNTARCCPTRATLLTGLYAHQAGIGHMMSDRGYDAYRGDLSANAVTIAEVLRGAGYATFMSGKWHVTRHIKPSGPKYNWPKQRGFDRFFGTIHGAGSLFDPNSLTMENTQIAPWDGFYYTEAISDVASRFIREHHETEPEQPFFLYVAYTSPHWPMHAWEKDIAKYRGRYNQGWDKLRQERYERMVDMGLIDPRWKLAPRDPKSPSWSEAELKPWEARCMEVYAAMVDNMDQGIGRIVDTLDAVGELENTLILFLADNGGCAENQGRRANFERHNPDLSQLRPMAPGALQFDMVPKVTRDGRPVRQGRGVMPGPADTYIAYGLSWANASNTPFREYKHWVHEGGISSPLIAHWPKGISAARRGRLESQPAHLIDLMATCVDLAGARYPKRYKGNEIQPMEGVSLVPGFEGASLGREAPLFFEHEGNMAVRRGRWKLVKRHGRDWELFNMEQDRTEQHDLSEDHPEVVTSLEAAWDAWAERVAVEPWPIRKNRS